MNGLVWCLFCSGVFLGVYARILWLRDRDRDEEVCDVDFVRHAAVYRDRRYGGAA